MKLGFGLYRHMLNREHYQFAKQCGATDLVVHLVDYFNKGNQADAAPRNDQPVGGLNGWGVAGDPDRLWEVADLKKWRQEIEAAGLRWYAIENFDPAHWGDILLDGPKRAHQIGQIKQIIRNVGEAGIPVIGYFFSLAGVAGRLTGPCARGGAEGVLMEGMGEGATTPIRNGMVWNMWHAKAGAGTLPVIDQETMWRRLEHFLGEIIPVAEKSGVRMAAHPDDPPCERIRGTPRLIHRQDGYDRLLAAAPSAHNGMEMCLGTIQEMPGSNVYEAVEKYSKAHNIAYVHLRNVKGKAPFYRETFVDEGDMDVLRVLRILKKNQYDGVIIPDHAPQMACGAPWHAGMAYAMGYLKAALNAASHAESLTIELGAHGASPCRPATAQGAAAAPQTRVFVGTYSQPGPYFHAFGEGLTACALDESTGDLRLLRTHPEVENAGYLAAAPNGLLAAMDRYMSNGEVTSFTFSRCGNLTRRASQEGQSGAVCHVAHAKGQNLVVTTAYMTGLTVHVMGADGVVMPAHQRVDYQGSGPNRGRQEASHPHQAVFSTDEKCVYVPDLGADKIWVHAVENGQLGPATGVDVEAGSGPRHAVAHPALPRLYLLCELDAKLRVYECRGANLRLLATHATLPAGFAGTPSGCAIRLHPSGKSLIVSNRESNTLAAFSVDAAGDLRAAGQLELGARNPRDFDFSPSGRWLVCVNMDSHSVTAWEVDPHTGLPTGRHGNPFACGSPTCVAFA